jgi:hypothetical protein
MPTAKRGKKARTTKQRSTAKGGKSNGAKRSGTKAVSTRKRKTDKELREQNLAVEGKVLELFCQGATNEQIANETGMHLDQGSSAVERGVDRVLRGFAQQTAATNFIRYALFQMRIIRRLDEACESFTSDEGNKQYNALVTALRAQSDIFDKLQAKGESMGIIQGGRVPAETKMTRKDLLNELRREHEQLGALIGEMEVTVERKTVRTRVAAAVSSDGNGSVQSQGSADEDQLKRIAAENEALASEIARETVRRELGTPVDNPGSEDPE